MSQEADIINLFVNRDLNYDLSLSNVQDISNTIITYEIISDNKNRDNGENVCNIVNNKIIALNEGICDIVAKTTTTNLFNASISKTKRVIVKKNNQLPLILGSQQPTYFESSVEYNLGGGSTTSPIILSCTSPNCLLEGNKITFMSTGKFTITALKEGDFMYNPVNLTWDVNVLPVQQKNIQLTISGLTLSSSIEIPINTNNTYELSVLNSRENPNITYSIVHSYSINPQNPVCDIIDGKYLRALNTGVCLLKAQTAKTSNFVETETLPIIITTIKSVQSNIILNNLSPLYLNKSITLNPTGGDTASPYTISIDSQYAQNCTLSGNVLYGLNSGDCIVTISKEGNNIYEKQINEFNIEVSKVEQKNAYIYLVGANNVLPDSSFNDVVSNVAISSVNVNRDISYQIVIENTKGNPNVKYKFIPRNILNEDKTLVYFYPLTIESISGQLLRNDAKVDYISDVKADPIYDASMSVLGLISQNENIYGRGALVTSNNETIKNQYVQLKPMLTGPYGLTFAFWGKMNNSPNKSVFFSFGNGPKNEEIYLGQNNSKLFAGYSRANNYTNTFEHTLSFPFENFNNDLWHYLVWVITADGTWKFYMDGLLLETVYDKPYPTGVTRKNNYLGYLSSVGMNNFRMYNKALNDNEIKYLSTYLNIFSSITSSTFYLDNNLKLLYNFEAYTIENALNFNGFNLIPISSNFVFTSNNLTVSNLPEIFKNGTYTASASSFNDTLYDAYQAFVSNTVTYWSSSSKGKNGYIQDPYQATTGIYVGGGAGKEYSTIVANVGTIKGEWLQIKLPYQFILKSYNITNGPVFDSRYPQTFYVVGSNDGISWSLLDYKNTTSTDVSDFNVKYNLSVGYSYIRLIVTKLKGGDINSTILNIKKFNISGNQFIDLLKNTYKMASTHNDKLVYNSQINNVNIIKNDDIINYGLFNASQKDFIQIDSLELNPLTDISGLSFSFWFKSNNSVNGTKIFEFKKDTKLINIDINNNSLRLTVNTKVWDLSGTGILINDDVWRHLSWVIKGTTWKLYIDSSLKATKTDGIYPDMAVYNANYFGRNSEIYLNGGISDFRLYNTELNLNQINDIYVYNVTLFFKLNQYKNLVFYYPLDSSSIQDTKIGNLKSGVLNYDGTMSKSGLITNKRALLSAPTDFLTLGSYTIPQNGCTICFSFCIKSIVEEQILFESSDNGNSIIMVKLNSFNDGYYSLNFLVSRKDKNSNTSFYIWIPFNEYQKWNHVSWLIVPTTDVYSTWKIYLDGKLYSVSKIQQYYPEVIVRNNNYIGKTLGTGKNFAGSVADIRLYSKILDESEINYFSTYKFFPLYKFSNNLLTPYNFGGIFIRSYIAETSNYSFGYSKTLILDITKSDQPDYKIVSGEGLSGLFDGSVTSSGIDGYNTDYLNSQVSGLSDVLACYSNGLKINSLLNNIDNESFILESSPNSYIYTNGNKIGSRGIKGNVLDNVKITKIGDYKYNDLSKIYKIWIKKNVRNEFTPIISHSVASNILQKQNNIYNIRINRSSSYTLSLSNYNLETKNYYFIINNARTKNGVIASIDGNNLIINNAGTLVLQCILPETNQFYEGMSTLITINIVKDNQAPLLITSMPRLYYKDTSELVIDGGSALSTIVYTSKNENVCTFTRNILNGINVGSCLINVTKNGDELYNPISIDISMNVYPINQTLTMEVEKYINLLKVDRTKSYKIVINNLKETPSYIKYRYTNTENKQINISSDGLITPMNAGVFTIYAEVGPTTNYAVTTVSMILNIEKTDQTTLSVDKIDKLNYNNKINVNIIGGLSQSSIVLSTDSSNCTISGNTIYGINTGFCDIVATKPNDFMYNDISTTFQVEVLPLSQPKMVISISGLTKTESGSYEMAVDRTKGYKLICNGQLENPFIIFDIYNEVATGESPVGAITANVLVPYNEGDCFIKAISTRTKSYLSTESEPLKVSFKKKTQANFIYTPINVTQYNKQFLFNVTGGTTSNSIILKSKTNTCSIDANAIKTESAGIGYITIFKEGNFEYSDLKTDIQFEIQKIEQPQCILQLDNINFNNGNNSYELPVNRSVEYVLKVTGYKENPDITYQVTPASEIYKISGNKLILYDIGTITIKAIVNTTTNYMTQETNTIAISIIKNVQDELMINYNSTMKVNDKIILVSSGGSIPDEPVKYSINNTDVCELNNTNNELVAKNSGNCTINVSKNGNFMYLPINKTLNIVVNKIKQDIKILDVAVLNEIFIDTIQYDLILNNLKEDAVVQWVMYNKVAYLNTSSEVATITQNGKITAKSAGEFYVKAITSETRNYLLTESEPIKIVVKQKAAKDFIIDPISDFNYNTSIDITVDNGQKNSQIIFTSNNAGLKIEGTKMTALKAGTYTVTATKPATIEYTALTKTFNITVNKINQPNFKINNTENTFFVNPDDEQIIQIPEVFDNASVTYKVSVNNVCKIVGSSFFPINAGVCSIIAIASETDNYKETKSEPFVVTVNLKEQEPISIAQSTNLNVFSDYVLGVRGGSTTNYFVIESLSPSIQVIDNSKIKTISVNPNAKIRIKKEGDSVYKTVTLEVDFNIMAIPQPNFNLLDINDGNKLLLNETYDLIIQTKKENPTIVYNIIPLSSINEADKLCKIVNDKIIPLKEGACIIQAQAQATNNYLLTTTNQLIVNIEKVEQTPLMYTCSETVNFGEKIILKINGGTLQSDILLTNYNNNFTLKQLSRTDFELTAIKSGSVTLTAMINGNNIYKSVSIDVPIEIKKINQPTITIQNLNDNNNLFINRNSRVPLNITGMLENATIKWSVSNVTDTSNNICTIIDNKLIAYNAGICLLEATTNETTNYLPTKSSNKITIQVNKNIQNDLIITSKKELDFSKNIQITTEGGSSDKINTYVVSNDVCTINTNILIGSKSGNCVLTVIKEGNDFYETISNKIDITVNKISQPNFRLLNINPTNTIYVNPNNKILLGTSPISEKPVVTFEVLSSVSSDTSNNICSFDGLKLMANNAGIIKIRAFTEETDNYLKTFSQEMIITVIKNPQDNILINAPSSISYNDEVFISGTGGNTINSILFSSDSSCCYIEGTKVSGSYFGLSNIKATKPGDFMYLDIIKSFVINVNKIKQQNMLITDLNKTNEIDVDPNAKYSLSVDNIKESPKITYQIIKTSNSNVARIDNNILVPLNVGTCTIIATSTETINYLSTVSKEFDIKIKLKTPSDFKVDNIPTLYYNSTHVFTTNGGQTDATIEYSSNDPEGLKIDGPKVKCNKAGNYVITAKKKATFMYSELVKTFNLSVKKLKQENFKILSYSQLNSKTTYLETVKYTEKFYKLTDVYNGNLNTPMSNTELRYIGENEKGIKIFMYNIGTTLYWTNPTGTGFDKINLSSLIANEWTIIDINCNNFTDAYIVISFKQSKNIRIIKLNGNPINIKSYTVLTDYATTYKPSNKNLLCGSSSSFYCNFISEIPTNILGYNGAFFTRKCLVTEPKYLHYNPNVPNVFVYVSNNNLTIVRDFETYDITYTSYPSYSVPISDAKNTNLVYILSNQYIYIVTSQVLRFDMNTKVLKVIYENTNNLWGLYPINSDNIILLIENNMLMSSNCSNPSTYLTYNNLTKVWDGIKLDNTIKWETSEISSQVNFKYTPETKMYSNGGYWISQDQGIYFFKSNSELNTFNLFSPISFSVSPLLEKANYVLKIVSSSTKNKGLIATTNGNQIVPITHGTCTIKAVSEETINYLSTETEITELNFDLLEQVDINILDIKQSYNVGDEILLRGYGGNTTFPIIFSSLSNNINIKNNKLSCTGFGEAFIMMYKEGDNIYKPLIKQIKINVNKGSPNVTLLDINKNNELLPNDKYKLNVTGLYDGINILYYTSADKKVCFIDYMNYLNTLASGEFYIYGVTEETYDYKSVTTNKIYVKINKNPLVDLNISLTNNKLTYGQSTFINSSVSDINFISLTPNICTINNNVVTAVGSGNCIISCIKKETPISKEQMEYFNFNISKISQPTLVLSDINVSNEALTLQKYPLKLSAVKENAEVKFIITRNYNENGVELDTESFNGYIVNNLFIGLKSGYSEIQAFTYETDNYKVSFSNKIKVKIMKRKQDIILISKQSDLLYLGSTKLLTSGGNSDNEVEYSTSDFNCKIINNTIIGLKAGKCKINALKRGNELYSDITSVYEITVKKIQQDFFIQNFNVENTIFVDPKVYYELKPINLKETTNCTYSFVNTSNKQIRIVDNKLYPLVSGKFIITATCNETDNYLASTSKSFELNIIKKQQQPLIFSLRDTLYFKNTSPIIYSGGSTYYSPIFSCDSSGCKIINNDVIGVNSGWYDIIGFKEGDEMYESISSTIKVKVNPIKQPNFMLKFINTNNIIYVNRNNKIKLNTTIPEENASIIYNVSYTDIVNKNPDTCIINGDELVAFNEGMCLIQAKSQSTHNYIETSSNIMFVSVQKNNQNELTAIYNDTIGFNETINIIGSGGSDTGSNIIYSSDSSNCKIVDNKLTGLRRGICSVKLFKDGNFMYKPIEKIITITIKPIKQKIVIKNINENNEIEVDPDTRYPLELLDLAENPKVTWKILTMIPDDPTNEKVCDIVNNIITPTNAGKIIMRAYTTETLNYLASETPDFKVTVTLKSAKNFVVDILPRQFVYKPVYITVDNDQWDDVAFEIKSSDSKLSISGNRLITNNAGTYFIDIIRKGNFMYKPLTKNIKLFINKVEQSPLQITNLEKENVLYVNPSKPIMLLTNRLKESPIILYSVDSETTKNVCVIMNNQLFAYNAGTCYIKATSSETLNYNSTTSMLYKITVNKNKQNNLIVNYSEKIKVGETKNLRVTGGNTSNAIIYTKSNGNCFIRENTIQGLTAGDIWITAYKEGNYMYESIETKFKITVTKNYHNIHLLDINPNNELIIDSSYNIIVDNVSEKAIVKFNISNIISDSNENICNIVDNIIYPLKAGICTLEVIAAETTNYYQTKSRKLTLTFVKKQQNKLLINYQTAEDAPIRLTAKYNTYSDLIISGGNTNKVSIISNDEICKIVKSE